MRGPSPAKHGKPRERRSRKVAIMVIAGAVAVVAAIAVVVVTVVLPSGGSTTGFVPTGSTPGQDAQQITTAFLQAWQAGNLEQAARYTSQPAAADAALVTYKKYLRVRKLTATAQSATAAGSIGSGASAAPRESVAYAASVTVTAPNGAKTLSGTWSYHSSLVAYQQPNSPAWYIAWKPDVLAPNLTAATHLAAISVAPQVVAVTDASGNALTTYGDAGLTRIAGLMQQKARPARAAPASTSRSRTARASRWPTARRSSCRRSTSRR